MSFLTLADFFVDATVADSLAISAVHSLLASLLTSVPKVPRATRALPRLGVTRSAEHAVTPVGAVGPVVPGGTRDGALQSLPTSVADALASLVVAAVAVLATAVQLAVLAVLAVGADIFTQRPVIARGARTAPVHRVAEGTVFTLAGLGALLAVLVEWASS